MNADFKLDILAIGAHPDDVELACSGTLMKMIEEGKECGVLDLSQGELGTRGTAELRMREAAAAAGVMGLKSRENAGLPDGSLASTDDQQLKVIQMIRKYRPEIVFANALHDRHPDHGNGSQLVRDAAFKSGLKRIETKLNGQQQEAWRPEKVYCYIQDNWIMPDFVVDITPYFEKKIEAIKAYGSQFYDPKSKETDTYISSKDYWNFIEARAREMGHLIGVTYGEGFSSARPVQVHDYNGLF